MKKKVIAGIVLVALLTAVIWFGWLRPRSLLDIKTRFAERIHVLGPRFGEASWYLIEENNILIVEVLWHGPLRDCQFHSTVSTSGGSNYKVGIKLPGPPSKDTFLLSVKLDGENYKAERRPAVLNDEEANLLTVAGVDFLHCLRYAIEH